MLYKREEPFRFSFQTPLKGIFKIVQINNKPSLSKQGIVEILDLSPKGLKLRSPLDLPIKEHEFSIQVTFNLNDKTITMVGKPIWKKKEPQNFLYGIDGDEQLSIQNQITEELKEFARRLKNEDK